MKHFTSVFKSLSELTRLRIIYLMLKLNKPLCICELMDGLRLAQYNVSKHMKELKNAGLVSEAREGKFVYYSLIKSDDKFISNVFSAILSIPDKTLKDDKKRLCCRLLERISGKCCGTKGK